MTMKKGIASAILAACMMGNTLTGCAASGYTGEGGSLRLRMPDEYTIVYNVSENYAGLGQSYTQTMTKCDEGYYFSFGNTGEEYIFEKQEDGRFLQYTKSHLGVFVTPTPTPVDINSVIGYASRIQPNIELYTFAKNFMTPAGSETVQGVACNKYTVAAEGTTWGKVDGTFWVAGDTGVCMKGDFTYQQPIGASGRKTIECAAWQTENVSLPDY